MPIPRRLVTILTLALSLSAGTLSARAGEAEDAKPTAKATKAPKASKGSKTTAKEATKPAAAPADKGGDPAAAPTAVLPPTGSPMAELKKSNAQLDKVLQKNLPNWTPESELQREEVRKVVGAFLDYAELGRRSLARHWDTLTGKQRDDFVNTLRDLVERSYLKQVHGSPNYTIKYDKEQKLGNEAVVDATLHTTARGKKVEVALEYKMLGKNGRWVVYDVLTDEQSMLENYRAEFNKIINKDGFDALVNRMKKKLEEKEE
jgi:phospholipid transport system substrate-binding protein